MPYARKPRTTSTSGRKYKKRSNRTRSARPARRGRKAPKTTLAPFAKTNGGLLQRDRPQLQRGPLPFAREMLVRLPYVDSFQQNSPSTASGIFGVTQWRLDSLFDPDVAAGGHQPMQYDQLTGIYKRFWPYGCKVEIEFSDPTADHLYVGYCIRTRQLASLAGKTIAHASELRNMKVFPMVNTGSQKKTLSFYVDLAKAHGIPKIVFKTDEETYSHAWNGFNATYAFLEIGTASTNLTSAGVNVRLRLTYFARAYNYETQSQS